MTAGTGISKRVDSVISGFNRLVKEGKAKSFSICYYPYSRIKSEEMDALNARFSQAYLTALALLNGKSLSYEEFGETLSRQVCHDVKRQVGTEDIKVEHILETYEDGEFNIKATNPKKAPWSVNFLSDMYGSLEVIGIVIDGKKPKKEMEASLHVSNYTEDEEIFFKDHEQSIEYFPSPIRKRILGIADCILEK